MSVQRRKSIRTSKTPPAGCKLTGMRFLAALCAAFFVYGPALTGPFVFDDKVQLYAKAATADQSLPNWINSVRPMLFFTFWLNHLVLGNAPLGYHLVNVIIHVLNTALVFLVTHRLLILYRGSAARGKVDLLAGFAAVVFLLHPIQTESVAYIASRSETLCAFFMLAALALFLYRRPGPVTWPAASAIMLLCVAACATKEQAVSLVPVLLLADLFWEADFSLARLRANWRLYVSLAAAGLLGAAVVVRLLEISPSAGFRLHDLTWLEYFLTECRVFFSYVRLFVLPVGQTLSPEVAISKNIFDHGSIFGLLGILALIAAAVYFRRRWRLASFGILVFIVLLAPTSSFVPLLDPLVEHRLYLPTLALTLVLLECLLRARLREERLVALCILIPCVCGAMSFSRNYVWGDEILLWQDAVSKTPDAQRPYLGLAVAYINRNRCREAENVLAKASARFDRSPSVLTLFSKAEECLDKFDEAADLMRRAAEVMPRAAIYMNIGLIRTRQGKTQDAYDAFERAVELDPSSARAYILRGEWYEAAARFEAAAEDFRHALQLAPNDGAAREHLDKLERRMFFAASGR